MAVLTKGKIFIVGVSWLVSGSLLLLVIDLLAPTTSLAVGTPTVDTIVISTTTPATTNINAIDLNEATNRAVYISGQISHQDGCSVLASNGLSAVFYRTGVSGAQACSTSNLNCYSVNQAQGACSIIGCSVGTETTVSYQCVVQVAHYADATDVGAYINETWRAYAQIIDQNQSSGNNSIATEINSLSSLDIVGGVDFGSLNLGATSTVSLPLVLANRGNTVIDVKLSGTGLTCANGGLIPVEKQRYDLSGDTLYDSMVSVSSSLDTINLNLDKQTSGVTSSKNLYFRLAMPANGLRGACGGSITILAINDA